MGQLLERVEALLYELDALSEETDTYLHQTAATHWIYDKMYCDKMSLADSSAAYFSVVDRLTAAYKANEAALRQALEKLQGSSGELKGVQVISSEVQGRQALLQQMSEAHAAYVRVRDAILQGQVIYIGTGDPIEEHTRRAGD
jgi:hypothetical protein